MSVYDLTILLIALVSICVHGFESVITFIVYTLKISTRFSMKETLKIPILRTDNKMAKGKTNTDLYSITCMYDNIWKASVFVKINVAS
jgi:hypothetical protein